jgi:hypothetical protein
MQNGSTNSTKFTKVFGFASKVMGHVRLGSAAGCEAVAMPRLRVAIHLWAMPLVRPLAQ